MRHVFNTFTFKTWALVTKYCVHQIIRSISLTRSFHQAIEILPFSSSQNHEISGPQISTFSFGNVLKQNFGTFYIIFAQIPFAKCFSNWNITQTTANYFFQESVPFSLAERFYDFMKIVSKSSPSHSLPNICKYFVAEILWYFEVNCI